MNRAGLHKLLHKLAQVLLGAFVYDVVLSNFMSAKYLQVV